MTVELKEGITEKDKRILYSDPLILRTGDDNHSAQPIDHPLLKYVSVFVGGDFVGAYILIEFSHCEREAHCFLLKSAVRFSHEISRLFLAHVFNDDDVTRLTGWVRDDLVEAINHNKKMGFVIEGRKRDSVRLDGKLRDLVLMGITRKDWEAYK